jgi:excisionase family DNA binding protein
MSYPLYSLAQVAERLGLHVRTVRNYVREGRLKAVRIGKQYRICAGDLAAMTGGPVSSFDPEPVRRHRHVEVLSIVEIDAISPDLATRLTTLLIGANNSRESANPLHVETIYDEERAQIKIILVGGMDTNASIFRLIGAVVRIDPAFASVNQNTPV